MVEVEVVVFISLFVIAGIASYIQNKKRASQIPPPSVQSRQKRTSPLRKISADTPRQHVPEDATLRRHYSRHLVAMIESQHAPRPSDSTLVRHYQAMITSELEQCLADEQSVLQLINTFERGKKAVTEQSPSLLAADKQKECFIPEDSTLKRHFISHLRSLIESAKQARPADNTLLRHYNAMIDAELESQLQQMSIIH